MASAEQRLFDAILDSCRERKWLKARGRQRTVSTHVLARVRAVNRLECVGETLRYALNSLAVVAPMWLHTHSQVEWEERYGRRVEDCRLPMRKEDRHAYAQAIGGDGYALLANIYTPKRRHGCARCLPSRRYAVYGSSNPIWSPGACIGGRKKKVFHRRGCISVCLMTLKHGTAISIRRRG
jgi:hypothetical protein